MSTDELLLVHEDPTTLVIGSNVRLDPRLDKGFIASIKERGVLEPIIAYEGDDDRLVVLRGKRRTLAACQAKRSTVPVVIVAQPLDADRLVDQLGENDHREALTSAERVGAYEQLAALGVTAAQIAKRTATDRTTVDAGLKVAKSTAARAAVEQHPLTIEQAAAIAEFDGDGDAVEYLVRAAQSGGGFAHAVENRRRVRADREEARRRRAAEAELIATTAAELTAAGLRVIDEGDFEESPSAAALDDLTHDGEAITVESHAGCPGAAVFLVAEWEWPQADDAAETLVCDRVAVCTDYEANGHTLLAPPWQSGTAKSPAPASAEAAEAAEAAAREERRQVLESNKAWDSAQTVRRDWLRRFLARKTPPKGAARFIAETLALADHPLRNALTYGHQLGHTLLGTAKDGPPPSFGPGRVAAATELLAGVTDARAEMITLGLMLAAQEDATLREDWRNQNPATVRYLRYLESQGYDLSEVEQRACTP